MEFTITSTQVRTFVFCGHDKLRNAQGYSLINRSVLPNCSRPIGTTTSADF